MPDRNTTEHFISNPHGATNPTLSAVPHNAKDNLLVWSAAE
jgi:hypothetical protein